MMFSFDQGNLTLSFLTAFFAGEPEAALKAKFVVAPGMRVFPRSHLGVMVFNGGAEIDMVAPDDVSGVVEAVNRAISYESLHEPPSQFALRLKG